MAKVLIIDDERAIRNTLKDILSFENHEVTLAQDGVEGIELVKNNKFDIILCDIKMPKMDGIEVLEQLMQMGVESPIVMISGHGTLETAVEAIKKGAYDFIEKPLDLNRLLVVIKNATERRALIAETKELKHRIHHKYDMVGNSEKIRHVKEMIERVAPTEARVLILGENGTGKEVVSRWLHEKSKRANGPFIEVNCAAIPSELIESELFGHEKGSFTGASKQQKGKFEAADGGTIFLDEIGDMSLAAQAKVLRVLQENKISRVGSDKEININVRVIAATNKNLKEEIKEGRFREDLYHRLSVIIIKVPSLNERLEDIPLLVDYFNKQISAEYNSAPKTFTDDAIEELQKINWTGNIREFRNVLERLLILCDSVVSGNEIKEYVVPMK
ncbi:MAG: sigma-54-dependent Fis family transcriptional regulator [Bacteroidales bacterium]|jgi:DNA-binding NtrC family response regulator|nr:sigma-54-dependent Fis family transcriptional regulator [Bacteroidales bacterium]